MNTKLCPICQKEVNFDLSEVHLIKEDEAGYEGLCEGCSAHVYLKFKLYKVEVTEFDDYMDVKNTQVFDIN